MDKRHKIVPLTLAMAMTMALVLPGDAAEAGGATPASGRRHACARAGRGHSNI